MADFTRWGKKVVHLTAEQKLVYHDHKEHAYLCIAESYDIKDIEAHRFLDSFEEHVIAEFEKNPLLSTEFGTYTYQMLNEHSAFFFNLKEYLTKFLKTWNTDEKNRDKTVVLT